ncbi:MAG TPA: M20/M25/M40 family metallo-hydrolase [Aggregatilineaceae bacterium]|nr:M20/M25/M40 family metallo-hydrolase [Aggregatilineaceae bacterium]
MERAQFDTVLCDLTALAGISGHEKAVRRYLASVWAERADQVWADDVGNVIARFGPEKALYKTAVLAHMDSVGLMVKRINSDGTLGVVAVGGVNMKALPGAAVRIGDGETLDVPGVIGVRAQHLARAGDEMASIDDVYVQVDPAQLPEIKITTPIRYAPQVVRLGEGLFCAPSLDNRAGCAVLVELARILTPQPDTTVYLVGTVQEETTCAGAMNALREIDPDVAVFVDGTVSYDTPETRSYGAVQLGGGPVLMSFLYVSGLNGWHAHPGLYARLQQVMEELDLPYQQDAVRGLSSDARVATWLGIPSVMLGLPMRSKHSPVEMVHLDDLIYATRCLPTAILEFIKEDTHAL